MAAKGDLLGFWPVSGRGHLEKFRARVKNGKRDFPDLGALLGEKFVHPKSFSQNLRNFFTFCVLVDRTPRGGKSQNTGFLGPFGLGQPLALSTLGT